MADTKKPKLTQKQRLRAIFHIAKMAYQTAPMAFFVQLFSSILNAALPIVTTYFAAQSTTALADAFTGQPGASDRVITFVLITAGLGVLSSAWSTLESYISQILQYKIETAVTDKMYEHFLRLDFWQYDDKETADTYDKAQHFARFFPYLFQRFASILTDIISLFSGLIALIFVSWWLALIVLAAVVPGLLIQVRLSRLQMKHWNTNVETRRSINIIEWDLFKPHHMAELRLYNMARHLLNLRGTLRDADQKERINFERSFILKRLGANALESAAEVTALIWTVIQISQQRMPIGQFVFVQQIVSRVLSAASGLTSTLNTIDEDLTNLTEYQKFIDMPEADAEVVHSKPLQSALTMQHISFSYPKSDALVLDDVSMTIKPGKHVAIVGENGAGKSTLIKIMTGLYTPTKGVVMIDDLPLEEYGTGSWHKQLAVLRQEYMTFGFASAKDNVYYGNIDRPFDQERFDTALDGAEAREFLEKLPNGVDNYVDTWMEDEKGRQGVELSGGQWQRLALARNFYRDSPIIILDEPTSAIDALAEARIFKFLFSSKDKTVITISHRLSTVRKADQIYMMENGKVVEQGTYKELVARKGAFYTMFESQF
jgi:ATP-binding cassette subfamily B protein/ATP-binding cassette subfamily C protein